MDHFNSVHLIFGYALLLKASTKYGMEVAQLLMWIISKMSVIKASIETKICILECKATVHHLAAVKKISKMTIGLIPAFKCRI